MCSLFFFSSRRRHTRWPRDWSSDVCSSDLHRDPRGGHAAAHGRGGRLARGGGLPHGGRRVLDRLPLGHQTHPADARGRRGRRGHRPGLAARDAPPRADQHALPDPLSGPGRPDPHPAAPPPLGRPAPHPAALTHPASPTPIRCRATVDPTGSRPRRRPLRKEPAMTAPTPPPEPAAATSRPPRGASTMTRRSLGTLALGGTAALAPLTAAPAPPAAAAAPPTDRGRDNGKQPSVRHRRRADRLIAQMSIEQKIGQLFVAVGYGSAADQPHESNTATTGVDTIAEIIATHHVGGLIYFAWSENLEDVEQVATLSNDAQQAALDSGGIALLISADEERGVVKRLPPPATPLPGAMAIGATGSAAHSGQAAGIVAAELGACGLNQSYTPVVDVNIEAANPVSGVRAFGADPDQVSGLGVAQGRGLQQAAIPASAKHFPGHGDTAVDSHIGLPVIDHSRAELDEIDLPPFRAAIDAGIDSIMTAHIVVPALDDSGRPATLSQPILTGLLREELGFEGVIVTDSLAMDGVRTMFDDDRVPVEAILAGADQMLMPPDLTVAIDGVAAAVASGEITEERLDDSVRRILVQKIERGVLEDPHVDVGQVEEIVGSRAFRDTAQEIADDAVTLIADDGTLPLPAGSTLLVTGVAAQELLDAAVEELAEHGIEATGHLLEEIDEAASEAAAEAAAGMDAALVLTSSVEFETPPEQVDLVAQVAARGTPVLSASLRNPYDVVHLGPVAASIAAYGNAECDVRAVARLIAGEIAPHGTLPVAIPEADGSGEAYPIGHRADLSG